MLIDINPKMELPAYKLVLCKMNKEKITELHNVENKNYTNYFASIDEFTFSVPMLTSRDGQSIRNEIYDLVEADYLLLLNNKQYFYIDEVVERESEDGIISKDIHAYSLEYELGNKRIVGYERVGRKLYTQPPYIEKDEDGFEIGILNYIETITSWKVERVASTLWDKERVLSFSSSNLLQVFQELQKTYGCLFKFNTVDETIEVTDIDGIGQNKGLYISDENFIKDISKTTDSKELKTRLIVKGKDDVSIHSLNITGQPYIENYNFYKNEKYMSKGLINQLTAYENFLKTKQGVFEGYLNSLNSKQTELDVLNNSLAELKKDLKMIQNDIDIAITLNAEKLENPDTSEDSVDSTKISLESLKLQETNKQSEIDSKKQEIESNKNSQKTINNSIQTLKSEVDLTNFLSKEQISEFDRFIKEDVYLDTNYTEENIEELLEEAKKILRKISQPKVTFDVDVFDFLSLVEYQHIWKNFISGDIVNLVHEKMGIDWQVRLIGYQHDIDNNDLKLTFSNKDSIDDANMYIADLIENMNTTSTSVDFSKYKWDKAETAEATISKYIDSELDLAKQAVLTAEGQRPILDDRGFWLYKENPDGSIDDKQMRLINNTLAISNDNWNTVSTAVSGDGINAEIIRGKLGQFAKVQANQVEVIGGGNIKDYADEKKQEAIDYTDDARESISNSLGAMAYEDVVESSKLGTTVIEGGYIKSNLIDVDRIQVGSVPIKDYIDNSTPDDVVTLGKNYNSTSITTNKGIVVNDGWSDKLQMGYLGGQDGYGFKAFHSDGSYSAMTEKGFARKNIYGDSYYLNDIQTLTGSTPTNGGNSHRGEEIWTSATRLYLDRRFRGKDISPSVTLQTYRLPAIASASGSDGISGFDIADIDVSLYVDGWHTGSSNPNPWVDVKGWARWVGRDPWGSRAYYYVNLDFLLTVLA